MNEPFFCKNCGNNFSGRFCNYCGEKVYSEKDKSVRNLLLDGFHFITHFDGTLFTTFKTMFTAPGRISLDYCNGLRKRYFKPLSFFLLLVILYLLFPVFEGLNMKLYFHETHNLYGKYAVAKTAAILEQRHISYEQLAGSFHQASEKISKFLLFIVIPFLALVSWRLGFRNRKYYFDHFVFTIEAFSFFILWGFLLLPFIIAVYSLGFGNNLLNADNRIGLVIIFAFMIYLAIATKRFFGFKWWYSIIYTILFSAALIAFLEYIYKFILFFIAIRLAK